MYSNLKKWFSCRFAVLDKNQLLRSCGTFSIHARQTDEVHSIFYNRLVEKYMQVEQVDTMDMEGEMEPSIKIEKEEGVELFWENNTKSKDIRDLAIGAEENVKEDIAILNYYR